MDFPKRKGFLYSRKSFSLLKGADLFAGLLSATLTAKVDGREAQFGTGTKRYGVTRGEFSGEVEFVFNAEAFFDFTRAHPQWMSEFFDFTGVFQEGAKRDSIEIVQCTFENSDIPIEGTSATEVTIKGMCEDVKFNGQSPMEGDSLGINGDAGAA